MLPDREKTTAGDCAAAARKAKAPILAIAATCLVILLAGCEPAQRPAARELDFWAMGGEGEAVAQLAPRFEAQHPQLRLRVQQVPWRAAHEKLLTAYVGGHLPDVFALGSTWLAEFAAIGALRPLDDFLREPTAPKPADFFAGAWQANRIGERQYGLPWYVDTRVWFYRRDFFPDPPRDWGHWRAELARVQRGLAPGRHALMLEPRGWEVPVIFAMQQRAPLLGPQLARANFDEPNFARAIGFYRDLYRAGIAPTGSVGLNLYEDFARGDIASFVSGPWSIGELRRRLSPAEQTLWAAAPIPAPQDGIPVSLAGGASLVIAADSEQPAAAAALLRFLAAPEIQSDFFRLTGDLPAHRAAWEAPELRADAAAQAFARQLECLRPPPQVPEWERIAERLSATLERLVRDPAARVDVQLARLDAGVDALLAKRRWLLARENSIPAPAAAQGAQPASCEAAP